MRGASPDSLCCWWALRLFFGPAWRALLRAACACLGLVVGCRTCVLCQVPFSVTRSPCEVIGDSQSADVSVVTCPGQDLCVWDEHWQPPLSTEELPFCFSGGCHGGATCHLPGSAVQTVDSCELREAEPRPGVGTHVLAWVLPQLAPPTQGVFLLHMEVMAAHHAARPREDVARVRTLADEPSKSRASRAGGRGASSRVSPCKSRLCRMKQDAVEAGAWRCCWLPCRCSLEGHLV